MARFDDFQIKILYTIWKSAYKPGGETYFDLDNLDKVLPPPYISPAARMVIQTLREQEYLDYFDGEYSISKQGIYFIENGLADPSSVVSVAINNTLVAGGYGNTSASQTFIPASDRVVTLNHNSGPYREAISALDAAVTAFREDHRLDNEWGSEKAILLQSIEAGQWLLKETQVRVATVFTTIIHPLAIVRDRYNESIAAGLVTARADHLISLVQKAISSILSLIGMS